MAINSALSSLSLRPMSDVAKPARAEGRRSSRRGGGRRDFVAGDIVEVSNILTWHGHSLLIYLISSCELLHHFSAHHAADID